MKQRVDVRDADVAAVAAADVANQPAQGLRHVNRAYPDAQNVHPRV